MMIQHLFLHDFLTLADGSDQVSDGFHIVRRLHTPPLPAAHAAIVLLRMDEVAFPQFIMWLYMSHALCYFEWVTCVLRGLQTWGLMPHTPNTMNVATPQTDAPAAVQVQFL